MLKSFSTKRFWFGLIAILFIYSVYYLLLADNKQVGKMIPLTFRYLIKIGIVFAVYFMGTYALGKLPQKWLLQIWHLIHISLISLLILLWAWHFGVSQLPLNLRRLGYSIHEFLISPLLYLATGLLGWISKNKNYN
jgi:hypothetical protein